jgi:ribosomal protein S18 acetylase RimI-like enzyme
MPPALHIREARENDLEQVNRLLIETWRDTYDPIFGRAKVDEITAQWHAVEVLKDQLNSPRSSFLVAEACGQIVGHALVIQAPDNALLLARLYVLPSHQHQGIGTRLLEHALALHPVTERLFLTVEAENCRAVAFYRKHEFAFCTEEIEGGSLIWRMERRLPPTR